MKKEINKNKGQNKFLGLMNLDSSFGIWKTIFILIFFFINFNVNAQKKKLDIDDYVKSYDYYLIDSFETSINYSNKILKDHKNSSTSLLVRATCNLTLGNYKLAYLDYNKLSTMKNFREDLKNYAFLNSTICKFYLKEDSSYIKDFKSIIKISKDTLRIAKCYAFLKDEGKSMELLKSFNRLDIDSLSKNNSFIQAEIYSLLNKKDLAFQQLEKHLENGKSRYRLIELYYGFDNLKSDPRFTQLLEKYKQKYLAN